MMYDIAVSAAAVIAVLAVYHHAVYPMILLTLARVRGAPAPSAPSAPADAPFMTVIMPVRDEGALLECKLQNLAALDYPRDKLRIIAACDGPSENSDARIAEAFARAHAHTGLQVDVMTFPESRGKTAVLNDILPMARGVAVLTDVSAMLPPGALLRAARWFSDPDVGAVGAAYAPSAGAGAQAYWRYQRIIKRGEAALGAPIGLHGALYFIRAGLFRRMPADTVNDDVIIPMAAAARGLRVVYDEIITAREAEADTHTMDFRRRRRIAAGNLQQVKLLSPLLKGMKPGVVFAFLSGKALRAVMPFLLAAFVLTAAGLSSASPFWAGVTACITGLGLAAALRVMFPRVRLPKMIDAACYAAAGYAAGFTGAAGYVFSFNRKTAHWGRVSAMRKAGA